MQKWGAVAQLVVQLATVKDLGFKSQSGPNQIISASVCPPSTKWELQLDLKPQRSFFGLPVLRNFQVKCKMDTNEQLKSENVNELTMSSLESNQQTDYSASSTCLLTQKTEASLNGHPSGIEISLDENHSCSRLCHVNDGNDNEGCLPLISESSVAALPVPFLNVTENTENQNSAGAKKQRSEQGSPEGKKYLKYQSPGKPDMRHQLLIQRTFSPRDENIEPRTSSPMRKVRACTDSLGCSPVRGTPAATCTKESTQLSNKIVPFMSPRVENTVPNQDVHSIFKTPIRAQHSNSESSSHTTPSRPTLSLFSSPAGSGSCLFTPGRHFVNPFEMDHEKLHMPVYSPSILNVAAASSSQKNEPEAFWSVEHAALLMPVEIKDSEVHRQLRHQQRIDREQDDKVQTAINAFFSNELIVPSPWSEKVNHFLPRTPGSIKSVSCQTTLSVPPGVDLLAELGGKYALPEEKTDSSPAVDSMGSSFIRRKLLNQLNENDSEILASPAISLHLQEKTASTSPTSGRRQSTPDWELQTPNKHSSGHFSSSPIREEPDERGHHPALSESDLLASPELSPIAGSRSTRSSAIYYSDHDMENPRAIMQLDFSSILEDNSDDEEDFGTDGLGTLIQRTATENQHTVEPSSGGLHTSTEPQFQASNLSSQDNETLPAAEASYRRPLLHSGLSTESALDIVSCSTSGPQLGSSQDTGYHTTSLQSTTNLALSSSSLLPVDGGGGMCDQPTWGKVGDLAQTDFTGLKLFKPDSSSDGIFSASLSSCEATSKGMVASSTNDVQAPRKREPCLIRKIRALSDMRLSREKKSVSRDLTHSFNMDCSGKSDSLSDTENLVNPGSRGRFGGMETSGPVDISMHSVNSGDFTSSHVKNFSVYASDFPNFKQSFENADKEFQEHRESEPSENNFRSKFSLDDDKTLEQARQLLGKSEELRQRHMQSESLERDSFHQVLMACDENFDPAVPSEMAGSVINKISPRDQVSSQKSASPQTPRILESIERNINTIQSSKLASEIAAEILKRAGDDLAKVTDILEDNSTSSS
ncbi:protein aurora borealis [Plakobranchus ocellatus]|uniref:Protein aurora borealis n=1 Tax=Plakobranchus ocellatus TaxID=259542 RepID=A0AAV4CPL5_9GAST|nr:protein aurora borealis [Plakobranchus ocellatus]